MKHYKTILLGFLALSFGSCGKEDSLEGSGNPENNGWVLVWSDEFNTPTEDNRPDPSKWTYELGASGFGNGELQNYTNKEKNASYTLPHVSRQKDCLSFNTDVLKPVWFFRMV